METNYYMGVDYENMAPTKTHYFDTIDQITDYIMVVRKMST